MKQKVGRRSKLTPEATKKAKKLAAEGKTGKQIAVFLQVSEKTIRNWKRADPEFLRALKEGQGEADDIVEASLFERAVGYSHPDVKVFCHLGEVIEVPTVKHYPPDAHAAVFWLVNRRPEKWKNIQSAPADPNKPHDQEAQIKALVDWYREVKDMK